MLLLLQSMLLQHKLVLLQTVSMLSFLDQLQVLDAEFLLLVQRHITVAAHSL